MVPLRPRGTEKPLNLELAFAIYYIGLHLVQLTLMLPLCCVLIISPYAYALVLM